MVLFSPESRRRRLYKYKPCGHYQTDHRRTGEAVLGDPPRLKGFAAGYASGEGKAGRPAFDRCIEYGGYNELKNADI
jgi:hypothetical protein